LGAFGNRFYPLSNGEGQVTNCAYNLANVWATPKWCKWRSANGHITWWRRPRLWEMLNTNLEKVH
jgi:hypothetical protein